MSETIHGAGNPANNRKTTDPWYDGSVAAARKKAVQAWGGGKPERYASALTSDFLTYANTAGKRLVQAPWWRKPRWFWRLYCAAREARFWALTAYPEVLDVVRIRRLYGPHVERTPDLIKAADQFDVLASLFLKSPVPGDFARAQECVKEGLHVIVEWLPNQVPLHTEGLLHCSSAMVELRRSDDKKAKEHHAKAIRICDELMRELGGSVDEPPRSLVNSEIFMARQTGRIADKISEMDVKLKIPIEAARYRKLAMYLFRLTGSSNQLL